MATIEYPCPKCHEPIAVDDEFHGEPVRCANCEQVSMPPTGGEFRFAVPQESPPGDGEPFVVSSPREKQAPIGSRASSLMHAILVPYSILMTVVAITYYLKFQSAKYDHPLSVIPDLIGEYRNASQRKAGAMSVPLPKPDQALPPELITSLGKPLTIGQIEATPLRIEQRPWTVFSKKKNVDEPVRIPIKDTLVLHLRLRNTSSDVSIFAMDPFFDRRPRFGEHARPFTLITLGSTKYFGGAISYEVEGGPVEREWLDGREHDGEPLAPGETREVVLVTRPSYAHEIAATLQKDGGEAIWRVHLRRGMYEWQGQEFSVAAVVGVRFGAGDIKKIG